MFVCVSLFFKWMLTENSKEMASTSFTVRIMPSKHPIRAVVCLESVAWPTAVERAAATAAAAGGDGAAAASQAIATGAGAAKAAETSGVRRSYAAGSVIAGLHLRLYDQGGLEVAVSKDTFEVRAQLGKWGRGGTCDSG